MTPFHSPQADVKPVKASLWEELEDKLHKDGTYHVTPELMGSIICELEHFRASEAAGCIVPNLPGLSQITASYTKGDPQFPKKKPSL